MELKKMSYVNLVINKKTNYDENTDAIVPDLYPDISKIIGVTATAYIKDTSVQNDRILISGDMMCEVCYVPEGELSPVIMKVPLSFAHVEQTEIEKIIVNCKAQLNKVYARIINPRKISILANICIHTKAYNEAFMNVSKFENDGYEILNQEKNINLIDSVNVSEFVISDAFEFKEIIANDYEMYGVKPKIFINDTKILKNKLMIRGEIEFSGTVFYENDMTDIKTKTAFSQVLDININDELLETFIDTSIKNFDIENINGTEFSFSLCVKTCITQIKTECVPIISDIYDVKNQITAKYLNYKVIDTPKYESEKMDFKIQIPCDNIIDKILHTEHQMFITSEEDNTISCYVLITGIYKSGNEYFDFEYEHMFMEKQKCSNIEFENIEITHQSTTEINLNVSLDVNIYKYKRINIDVLDAVERGESHEKFTNTIILKHISSKKTLWEIAKQYNTTTADIIASNSLEIDTLEIQDMMILIPIK